MFENKVDQLIEECITELSSDDIRKGGESLQELARYWAKAGLTLKSFLDMRTYIIEQAKLKTDALFIEEKLKLHEQALREERTNSRFIIIEH